MNMKMNVNTFMTIPFASLDLCSYHTIPYRMLHPYKNERKKTAHV